MPGTRMVPRQPARPPRLELLTRAGCHLCEEMATLLDEVLPEYGLAYRTLDVDGSPELRARYGEVVPVLLRDGRAVAKVGLDRRRLERILSRRRGRRSEEGA